MDSEENEREEGSEGKNLIVSKISLMKEKK
jgi:hypothetical protein